MATQRNNNRGGNPNPNPKSKPAANKNSTKFTLRPIEAIGIGLFVFAVLVYSFNKCNRSPARNANNASTTATLPALADSAALAMSASNLRPLYVVIDSLKLRPRPQLDTAFIRYLYIDELVYDMGEQTNYTQTIRYSADDVRTEPWVKIRTKKGDIGWVFGAGVNFYRKKNRNISAPANVSITASSASTSNPSAANAAISTITRPSLGTATQPSAATATRPSVATPTRPSVTPR